MVWIGFTYDCFCVLHIYWRLKKSYIKLQHLPVTLKAQPSSLTTGHLRRPTDIRKHRPNRRQLRSSTAVVHFCTAAPNRLQPLVTCLRGSRIHFANRKHGGASGFLALCDNRSQFGVLGFFVATEVDFSLEGSSAEIAGEGFEAGVFAGVCDEVARLTEGFAAYCAFVGFFTWKRKKYALFRKVLAQNTIILEKNTKRLVGFANEIHWMIGSFNDSLVTSIAL